MTNGVLDDATLKAALAELPGERITDDYIVSRIARTSYMVVDDITTVCVMVLDNGYRVFGFSTPASPENFREDIGRTYAAKDAMRKLWPMFGFLLREKKFREGKA